MKRLIEASVYQLRQMQYCISLFDDQDYAKPLSSLSGSTVGMHFRHVIEFYQHLLASTGIVDYDARERSATIEKCTNIASRAVEDIIRQIGHIEEEQPLTLYFRCLPEEGEALSVSTSLLREMVHNLEHCIHHQAIVKAGIVAHFPEKQLPGDFGVAYSTQRHLQSLATT